MKPSNFATNLTYVTVTYVTIIYADIAVLVFGM